MNRRDKLKKKAIFTNLEQDWLNYKISRNEVNITIITGHKLDPKIAWKSINNLLGRHNKPTVVNELNLNDNHLTTFKDIAEGFNDYFSNIGPELATEIQSSNINFEMYAINAKSEFTAFKPVMSAMSIVYVGFQATKPVALIRFRAKLLN